MSKNVLITGITGMVGSHLADYLLEQTNWNQLRTAKILGINRNTLRKKIKTLGLKKQRGIEK